MTVLQFRCLRGRHHHDRSGRYCYVRVGRRQWLVQDNISKRGVWCTSLGKTRTWIKAATVFRSRPYMRLTK